MRFNHKEITRLREKQGTSKSQMARDLSTSRQRITDWEAGKYCPNIGAVGQLCSYFGIKPNQLFTKRKS